MIIIVVISMAVFFTIHQWGSEFWVGMIWVVFGRTVGAYLSNIISGSQRFRFDRVGLFFARAVLSKFIRDQSFRFKSGSISYDVTFCGVLVGGVGLKSTPKLFLNFIGDGHSYILIRGLNPSTSENTALVFAGEQTELSQCLNFEHFC